MLKITQIPKLDVIISLNSFFNASARAVKGQIINVDRCAVSRYRKIKASQLSLR